MLNITDHQKMQIKTMRKHLTPFRVAGQKKKKKASSISHNPSPLFPILNLGIVLDTKDRTISSLF
jgi:hypothetical protein